LYLPFVSPFTFCSVHIGPPQHFDSQRHWRWKYRYTRNGVSRGATLFRSSPLTGSVGGTQTHERHRHLSCISAEARTIGGKNNRRRFWRRTQQSAMYSQSELFVQGTRPVERSGPSSCKSECEIEIGFTGMKSPSSFLP